MTTLGLDRPQNAVDWSMLLHELRFTHGMTMHDIAGQVSLSRESIRTYYSCIARPKHHDGEAIITLWMRVTGQSRERVPSMPIQLSAADFRES